MKTLSILTLLAAVSLCSRGFAAGQSETAEQWAKDLWKASGGDQFSNVGQLRFSFVVDDNGKELFKAEHVWDVPANTDDVTWKDKTGKEKHVKVNLGNPGTDADSKAAYGRWVNDSYWLLAPIKVLDHGVHLKSEGMKAADGMQCEALRLSFDKIGLTPNDEYVFYIDPETKLLRAWDYIPTPEKTIHGTWEKYQNFGGLNLATEHQFNGKTIRLANIKVSMAK